MTVGAVRQRTRTWVVAALAAAAVAMCLQAIATPAPAAAEQNAADLGMAVEFGYGRGVDRHSWTLVEVRATPPVPLRGRIQARVSGPLGTTTSERAIEVAAGATQVFYLLLPPSDGVEVTYLDDDGQRINLADRLGQLDRNVRVGGLSAAPDLPSPLNTVGTDRAVSPVAVDAAALALGPRALDALDAVVVSAGDLTTMTDDERDAIMVAVAGGLDLVVTVGAGDGPLPLPWNPVAAVTGLGGRAEIDPADGAWAATAADFGLPGDEPVVASVRAGRGRVIAVAATPGDGGAGDSRDLWGGLFQVRTDLGSPLALLDQGNEITSMLFGGEIPLPGVLVFAIFALVYIVLVGPVNGIVLRRLGRRELAWVTVPALTLVFTVAAVTTAAGRAPVQTPVVRAAWWVDGVGQELTAAAVQAPARGIVDVRLPGARDGLGGQLWGSTVSTVERDGDATAVRVHLDTLAQASVLAWGDPGRPPPLDVVATTDGSQATVEITNTATTPLEDVKVVIATSSTDVGRLDPGAQTTVVVDDLDTSLRRANNAGMAGVEMLGAPRPPRGGSGAAAARSLLAWGVLDGSPGTVWVTATSTDDLGLAVPDAPGTIDDHGSFVAVGTTLQAGGGSLLPHAVTRDLLRTDNQSAWRPAPLEIEASGELVLRFRLPGPATPGTLLSTLDVGGPIGGGAFPDIWSGGCFEVVEIAADGTQSEPEEQCGGSELPCPPDSDMCSESGTVMEACFPDGSCRISTWIDDAPDMQGAVEGFEVFDHATAAWVPLAEAFPDGRAGSNDGFTSPLGEVLVRARNGGLIDIAQRGIGFEAVVSGAGS